MTSTTKEITYSIPTQRNTLDTEDVKMSLKDHRCFVVRHHK